MRNTPPEPDSESNDPVDTLSDRDLAKYISKARQHPSTDTTPESNTLLLTSLYVSKFYTSLPHAHDVQLSILQAHALGIRAPELKRIVKAKDGTIECLFTRIQGPTLESCWQDLSLFTTLRLAVQLRTMVQKMRTITRPTAGSLGTGACRSFWLEEFYGVPSHASAAVVRMIVNFWCGFQNYGRERKKTLDEHRKSCEGGGITPPAVEDGRGKDELVFTHHDLAPRNIILEKGTRNLWLVDWDESGFYPRYFEYAGMRNLEYPLEWGWYGEWRWRIFCWIVAGFRSYDGQAEMLRDIRQKAGRFPGGRRFNIKAGVTPSERPVDD
ncbi:putative choline kinase [Triangularia setosa]|uniref:Choline kinase n=1 Tax=Triangularia setosa TaxID=2587417 RepID=A0AAN6W2R1_9PEZI|nr:putative choline kinase [Podospora setosa]